MCLNSVLYLFVCVWLRDRERGQPWCATRAEWEEFENITSADPWPLCGTEGAWTIHYLPLFLSLTYTHVATLGLLPYLLVRPQTGLWVPPWPSWGSVCCRTCGKEQGWRRTLADRSPVDKDTDTIEDEPQESMFHCEISEKKNHWTGRFWDVFWSFSPSLDTWYWNGSPHGAVIQYVCSLLEY